MKSISQFSITSFLDELKVTAKLDVNTALSQLYEYFADWLVEGEYVFISELLINMEPDIVSIEVAVGALTITVPWRNKLPGREFLVEKVRNYATNNFSELRTAAILHGLE